MQAVPPKKKVKQYHIPRCTTSIPFIKPILSFCLTTKTFKYALVAVDLHSGLTDAEPLEDKTAEATATAIKTVYRRSILDFPNRLETDPGSEFKWVFAALMIKNNVDLRRVDTGSNQWLKTATTLSTMP